MGMNNLTAVKKFIATALLLSFYIPAIAQSQQPPTLKETTDWIHNFTEVHGSVSGDWLGPQCWGGTNCGSDGWSEVDHATFAGCNATVVWVSNISTSGRLTREKAVST